MMNKRVSFFSLCLLISASALHACDGGRAAVAGLVELFFDEVVLPASAGVICAATTALSVKDLKEMVKEMKTNNNTDIKLTVPNQQKKAFNKDCSNAMKMTLMAWAGSYLAAKYGAKVENPGQYGAASGGLAGLVGVGFLGAKYGLDMKDRRLREFAGGAGVVGALVALVSVLH